jgi:F-type H+-transporting ATPase subunit delta
MGKRYGQDIMNIKLIARRYALALYEAAAENNSLESAEYDMSVIRRMFAQAPQIREYCLQSHGDNRSEQVFIETAFFPYTGPYTKNMLSIAIKNKRLPSLPFIPGAFDRIADEKNGIVAVVIETAHTYSDEMISLLSQKMRKRIQKEIKIQTRVNPALLGGFRILWQNKILDRSAAGRIKEIRRMMLHQT